MQHGKKMWAGPVSFSTPDTDFKRFVHIEVEGIITILISHNCVCLRVLWKYQKKKKKELKAVIQGQMVLERNGTLAKTICEESYSVSSKRIWEICWTFYVVMLF